MKQTQASHGQKEDDVQGSEKAVVQNAFENKIPRFKDSGVKRKDEVFKSQGNRYALKGRADQQEHLKHSSNSTPRQCLASMNQRVYSNIEMSLQGWIYLFMFHFLIVL